MGERGPKPEPVALRILKGETRPSRTNPTAPEPPAGDGPPAPPKWLDRHARSTWRRLAPSMYPVRLLTDWDLDAFAAYCSAVSIVRTATELLAERGLLKDQLVAARREGEPVTQEIVAPAFKAYREAVATMRALASEFGLTPSARATIKLEAPRPDGRARASELLS